MGTNKISQYYVLFSVLGILHVLPFVNSACLSPLGMENGRIKDSQITVSSAITNSNTGGQARLRQNIGPYGAWCPKIAGRFPSVKTFDEYIQIDLLSMTNVTAIATQGREKSGGIEFVKEYKISYSEDRRTWIFYPEKHNAPEAKIFRGNEDNSSVTTNDLNPAVTARYIRVHPGQEGGTPVCMRLELYGCVPGENEKAKTENISTPVIVVIVISLVALLNIVVGILEYKRRHRASQMTTSVSVPEEKVELRPLRPIDFVIEPSSNTQDEDYETPGISDLEPHYEEVAISPPSVYTSLDRNEQGGSEASDDSTYQKLLQQDSDYVNSVDGGSGSYEEVKITSPPGYTELDKSKQDESTTNNADDYQKLLKYDPNEEYVIPTDTGAEAYEEVGRHKTVPGYKELDSTKRELDDNASYEKLIKN